MTEYFETSFLLSPREALNRFKQHPRLSLKPFRVLLQAEEQLDVEGQFIVAFSCIVEVVYTSTQFLPSRYLQLSSNSRASIRQLFEIKSSRIGRPLLQMNSALNRQKSSCDKQEGLSEKVGMVSDEGGQAEGEAYPQAAKFRLNISLYENRFKQQPKSVKLLRHSAEQPPFNPQILRTMSTVEQYSPAEL